MRMFLIPLTFPFSQFQALTGPIRYRFNSSLTLAPPPKSANEYLLPSFGSSDWVIQYSVRVVNRSTPLFNPWFGTSGIGSSVPVDFEAELTIPELLGVRRDGVEVFGVEQALRSELEMSNWTD